MGPTFDQSGANLYGDPPLAPMASAAPPNIDDLPTIASAPMDMGAQSAPNIYASAPAMPMASVTPPGSAAAMGAKLGTDEAELSRLQSTGSGVSQVHNKFLRTLGRIGDAAGTILAPGVMSAIPGTTVHNWTLQNLAGNRVAGDQNSLQAIAQLDDTKSQQKLRDQQAASYNAKTINAAAKLGMTPSYDDKGNLASFDPDPNSPITKSRAMKDELVEAQVGSTQAQQTLRQAQAKLDEFKSDPKNPQYTQAAARLETAKQNALTAQRRLALSNKNYMMHAYGTDDQGNELPGVLHDANGNPIGSVQAQNVRPTAGQRDAAGRADSMVDIGNRIRASLDDPEIQSYLGPIRGRVSAAQGEAGLLPDKVSQFRNDLVSYGAFQAGLHPVRGIGALQYFDHVMGGLGQTPEELRGKLNSNDETAADVQRVGTMPTTDGLKRARTAPNGPALGGNRGNALAPPRPETRVYQGHTYTKGANGWVLQQ